MCIQDFVTCYFFRSSLDVNGSEDSSEDDNSPSSNLFEIGSSPESRLQENSDLINSSDASSGAGFPISTSPDDLHESPETRMTDPGAESGSSSNPGEQGLLVSRDGAAEPDVLREELAVGKLVPETSINLLKLAPFNSCDIPEPSQISGSLKDSVDNSLTGSKMSDDGFSSHSNEDSTDCLIAYLPGTSKPQNTFIHSLR